MISFRDATDDDAEALATLLAELDYPVPPVALPARLNRFRNQSNGRVLLALSGHHVVAFAAVEITYPIHLAEPVAHVTSFAVARVFRRQGVGQRLLSAVEDLARGTGCHHVVVTSAEHREDAHAFYSSAGWLLTGRRFGKSLH
jgi:GNAT superfamily N-acetyltransferase